MRKTCFETIHKIAKKDKIIFIGSDLTPGIMGEFKKDQKVYYGRRFRTTYCWYGLRYGKEGLSLREYDW